MPLKSEIPHWDTGQEEVARRQYEQIPRKKHALFSVCKTGLHINPDHSHFGTSSDGLVTCSSCGDSLPEVWQWTVFSLTSFSPQRVLCRQIDKKMKPVYLLHLVPSTATVGQGQYGGPILCRQVVSLQMCWDEVTTRRSMVLPRLCNLQPIVLNFFFVFCHFEHYLLYYRIWPYTSRVQIKPWSCLHAEGRRVIQKIKHLASI